MPGAMQGPLPGAMLGARVAAIGLVTPGIESWAQGCQVLRGDLDFQPRPLSKYDPSLLPANERRRATPLIRLALRAIEDCLGTVTDHQELASVFASSGGDMDNLHAMCEQLAKHANAVSPTGFHNSVHNAVAGYWSIGGHARAASISISAHDASFVAGLLEALGLVAEYAAPVLYVAYDIAVRGPLFNKRPVTPDFAAALLLTPHDLHGNAMRGNGFHIERAAGLAETTLREPGLEAVRLGNPAARVLPLLRLVATHTPGTVVLADDEARWLLRYQAGSNGSVNHVPP